MMPSHISVQVDLFFDVKTYTMHCSMSVKTGHRYQSYWAMIVMDTDADYDALILGCMLDHFYSCLHLH